MQPRIKVGLTVGAIELALNAYIAGLMGNGASAGVVAGGINGARIIVG